MKTILPALCLLLGSGLLAASLNADEVRLKDGRVLVGRVRISGKSVSIETRTGKIRVLMDQVLRIRTDRQLRAELVGLAQRADRDSPHTHLQLARSARGYGLMPEMWRSLEQALMLSQQTGSNKSQISRFLGGLEHQILPTRLHQAKAQVRVRELLFRIRPGTGAALKAAVHEILANMPAASLSLRRRARQASSGMQRLAALAAIQDRSEQGSGEFVYRAAILDHSAALRRDAMLMTAADDHARAAVQYLAPGLSHASARVRMRTADAFANLDDSSAIDLLVAAGPLAAAASLPGGSTRAHMAVLTQTSFIRDYDVEIAQSAFIANPVVDVLQSGVVLDVTVHAVTTVRVQVVDSYRRALKQLAGSDPGARTEEWSSWLAEIR